MSRYIFLALLGLGGCFAANAQNTVIKDVPARMSKSLEGVDLFREYCAVCHGVDAKGNGPAAPATKKHPSDLTALSRKNGGKFPALAVLNSIKGDPAILEHGTGEMPIWGFILSQSGQQKSVGQMRVNALMKYIESVQAK